MTSRLLYVMDPMCSWCWGFASVVRSLIAQAAAAGVASRVVVGGLRATQTEPLDASTRRYILEHWQAVEGRTGQGFNFAQAMPEGFIYNTEPACRALVTARQLQEDSVWRLLDSIQRAFYLDAQDVTQAAVLTDLATQAGLPRTAFAEAFDSPDNRQATQADFSWVGNLGIAGFPTLLAERDGQFALLTNGYQPLQQLAPLLQRWLERGQDV